MRTLSLLLTGLALACVVVAVSPLGRAPGSAHDVVFLLDVSRSVTGGHPVVTRFGEVLKPDLETLPRSTRVRLIPFASRPAVWLPGAVSPAEALDALARDLPPVSKETEWATRVDLALRHAGSLLDDRRPGTVVLVTDGHPAEASAVDAARQLAARGHRVFTRAAPMCAPDGDLFLDRVDAPLAVRPGEPVRLRVQVGGIGDAPRDFRLVVREVGSAADPELRRARWDGRDPTVLGLRFPGRSQQEQRTFTLHLEEPAAPSRARETSADSARVTVMVGAPVRLRWLGGSGGPPVAFTDLGPGFALEAGVDLSAESLASAEVVIVEDVAFGPAPLDGRLVGALVDAVASGTGFLVVGARAAFGPGGWVRSGLDPILAVRPERPGPRNDTTLLLDASGSMAIGGRWPRATAAALAFVGGMQRHDRVRVTLFAAAASPVLPWQGVEAADGASATAIRAVLRAAVVGRRPSGPTNLGPAVEEALRGFARLPETLPAAGAAPRRRRLLVLSDGNLGEPESVFADLGRRLEAARIRVGVVASGDSLTLDGRRRLQALTLAGTNGRLIQVAAGDGLRQAFREAGSPSWWRSGSIAVRESGAARPADVPDLVTPFPPVGRLVVTTPRTDGATVLAADEKEGLPVLAVGRHGDGRIAAFPASLRHPGSAQWNRGDRWRQLIRWLARGAAGGERPLVQGRIRGGRLEVVARLAAGAPLGGWSYEVADRNRVAGGTSRALWPSGPRHLAGCGPAPDTEVSILTLRRDGRRLATGPVRRDPGEELRRTGPNPAQLRVLAAAGGGRLLSPPAASGTSGPSLVESAGGPTSGAPALIWAVLALALFLAGRGVKSLRAQGR